MIADSLLPAMLGAGRRKRAAPFAVQYTARCVPSRFVTGLATIWSNLPDFTYVRKRAGLASEGVQVERMKTQMATTTRPIPRATGAASTAAPL
jgi:hypothetical protein